VWSLARYLSSAVDDVKLTLIVVEYCVVLHCSTSSSSIYFVKIARYEERLVLKSRIAISMLAIAF
jgi:hypothetical protein